MNVPRSRTALLTLAVIAAVAVALVAPSGICQPPAEPAEPAAPPAEPAEPAAPPAEPAAPAAPPAEPAAPAAPAVPQSGLAVAEIIFASGIDRANLAVIDPASEFDADVQQVVCYTRITGAQESTVVTHAWYYEGKTKAKVELAVGSASWRTYSTKQIQPTWTGQWEVKVLDESGAVLASASFTVQ